MGHVQLHFKILAMWCVHYLWGFILYCCTIYFYVLFLLKCLILNGLILFDFYLVFKSLGLANPLNEFL